MFGVVKEGGTIIKEIAPVFMSAELCVQILMIIVNIIQKRALEVTPFSEAFAIPLPKLAERLCFLFLSLLIAPFCRNAFCISTRNAARFNGANGKDSRRNKISRLILVGASQKRW